MIENEILKLFPDPILKYKLDDCKNLNIAKHSADLIGKYIPKYV